MTEETKKNEVQAAEEPPKKTTNNAEDCATCPPDEPPSASIKPRRTAQRVWEKAKEVGNAVKETAAIVADIVKSDGIEPSLVEQIGTATGAAVSVATGEAKPIDDALIEQRRRICSLCPFIKRFTQLPKGADIMKGDRCSKCGCVLKYKTSMYGTYFRCPRRKWGYEFENPIPEPLADDYDEKADQK